MREQRLCLWGGSSGLSGALLVGVYSAAPAVTKCLLQVVSATLRSHSWRTEHKERVEATLWCLDNRDRRNCLVRHLRQVIDVTIPRRAARQWARFQQSSRPSSAYRRSTAGTRRASFS